MECPDDLYDALANTWSDHPQYGVVCDIVLDGAMDEEGGVGDQQDEDDDQDATLMNTFYRQGGRVLLPSEIGIWGSAHIDQFAHMKHCSPLHALILGAFGLPTRLP